MVANSKGYHNLCRILSAHSFKTLTAEKFLNWQEGLFLLVPPDHPHMRQAKSFLSNWNRDFLYFELQRYEGAHLSSELEGLVANLGAKFVATQPTYYLKPEDHRAHEILLSIGAGTNLQDEHRPRRHSTDFFLKSADDFSRSFKECPEALRAKEEIAK